MDTLRIVSTNYNGQSAVITFYPDTGGTINLGTQVLPYDYVAPYFYGTYTLFFPSFGSTCTLYVEDLSGNFLLQESRKHSQACEKSHDLLHFPINTRLGSRCHIFLP